jgi:DNA end-binding protein Ku
VNIPVGMYSATEDHAIRFHQFEAGTSDRIRYSRVNERSGQEVAFGNIVKGYDLGGESVIVTPDELAAAAPQRSSTIEITDFVELTDIDPIYFRTSYYLAPKNEGAAKPYRLLHEAMAKTNKAGVSMFVMRNKEYLSVVRADMGLLVLETLYWADEVREPKEVLGDLPEAKPSTEKELKMAVELVNALSGSWNPDAYHDTYQQDVKALIDRKQKGDDVVVHAEETKGAPIVDLMDALKQSVDRSRGKAQPKQVAAKPSGSGATSRPTKAKSSAPKRTSRPAVKATKRTATPKAKASPSRAGSSSRRKAS